MAYENLCMYCFKDMGGEAVCPHCGRDSRAAVPQIQMLPGSLVYHDRFLVGRALDFGGVSLALLLCLFSCLIATALAALARRLPVGKL